MINNDSLQRFLFEQQGVRGEIIHLNAAYQAVLDRHPYPLPVQRLLGELLAASCLLSAILKIEGSIIMQIHSEGPVNLLVAQADHQHHIRGLARWDEQADTEAFSHALSGGRLVITIDQGASKPRYQGVVDLVDANIAKSIEYYFQQSEQLSTAIFLTANATGVAGMLMQVLPSEEAQSSTFWEHLQHLFNTLTAEELLNLSNQEIITRLFHEEEIRLFDHEPVMFRCGCSRERTVGALRLMAYEEIQEILQAENVITISCEFCNHHYTFDAVDIAQICADVIVPPDSSSKH